MNHRPPLFSGSRAAYLHTGQEGEEREEEETLMSPEPGSEVGGQRKENISHTWSVFFFKLKRASNNIQKKGPAGLPAGRCRCASQADEGLVSKLHLFNSLRGILHCLL